MECKNNQSLWKAKILAIGSISCFWQLPASVVCSVQKRKRNQNTLCPSAVILHRPSDAGRSISEILLLDNAWLITSLASPVKALTSLFFRNSDSPEPLRYIVMIIRRVRILTDIFLQIVFICFKLSSPFLLVTVCEISWLSFLVDPSILRIYVVSRKSSSILPFQFDRAIKHAVIMNNVVCVE